MSKSLNDILRRYSDALAGKRDSTVSALTTGENPGVDYADKMKDTRDFIAQHSVERFDDRVGNGDDVYKASKVKKAEMQRHGHEPKPKDIKVYNKNQQAGQKENVKEETEQLDEVRWNYTDVNPKMVKTILAAHRATGNAARHMGGGRIAHTGKLFKPDKEETNEEVEQIDELDKETLKSYRKKASDSAASALKSGDRKKFKKRIDGYHLASDKVDAKVMKGLGKKAASARHYSEETEQLDEITLSKKTKLKLQVRARDRMLAGMDNRSDDEYKTGKRLQDMINKRKVRNEETKLSESKCNMTEAGKMCEVHGNKACPKENSASDKEPRVGGKNKEGKQLITDKKLNEKLTKGMSAGDVIKDFEKSDDPRFKGDTKEQRKKRALAAWYKLQKEETVEESILDQRSAKATASEKSREKIFAALERRKEKAMDHKMKMKMKEQAAPVETPITFPATNSREGLRV